MTKEWIDNECPVCHCAKPGSSQALVADIHGWQTGHRENCPHQPCKICKQLLDKCKHGFTEYVLEKISGGLEQEG